MQDDSRKNIKAVSFSPDNQCLAAGSNDGKVKLWNIK
jgi:WD40 repeat protein